MALKFGPESAAVKSTLKHYGVLSFRAWEPGVLNVAINGYLLEPYQDPSTGKSFYRTLLVSVLGTKSAGETYIKKITQYRVLYPYPSANGIDKNQGYVAEGLFQNEQEKKEVGLTVETKRIEGTMWWQTLAYRKDLLETTSQDGMLKAYLIGVDVADADLGFPRLLRECALPYLPEWLDILKAEIKSRREWTTRLAGHQMTGWKINIPRKALFALVQELAREGKLPLPVTITAKAV